MHALLSGFVVVVVVLFGTVVARSQPLVFQFEKEINAEAKKYPALVEFLSKNDIFKENKVDNIWEDMGWFKLGDNGGFSWKNCGKPGDLLNLRNLSIAPDPIVLPGSLSIGFAFNVLKTFGSPFKASVVLQKKIGSSYITIPCIGEFGSCNYTDFCDILNPIAECPPEFAQRGIPCKCPFPKGNYSLPDITFDLDAIPLPPGGYHARIEGSFEGAPVGCVEVNVDISS